MQRSGSHRKPEGASAKQMCIRDSSRTHLAGLHCFSHIRLRTGIVRKADAKMTEYGECKSGTVRALGQAGACLLYTSEFLTRFEKVAKETLAGNGKTLSNNVDFYSGFAYNCLLYTSQPLSQLFL